MVGFLKPLVASALLAAAVARPVKEERALSLGLGIIDATLVIGGKTVTTTYTTTTTTFNSPPTTTPKTTSPTTRPTTTAKTTTTTAKTTSPTTANTTSPTTKTTTTTAKTTTTTAKTTSPATQKTTSPTTTKTTSPTTTHPTTTGTLLTTTVSPPKTSPLTKTTTAETSTSTGCASASGDAPYSLSCSELSSVITFPNGFQNKAGGIVFLVHGTGSTGSETWSKGPYNTILPYKGLGYDIAWFTSPTRSLGDAQVNAEYIAYNIKALAQKSKTGKVFIIGHSQGNINIQWALEFWPSMRQYVSGFSSLAGDFHGTAEGPLLCIGQDLLQNGCEPGVLQQNVGSHYLAAQNAQGGSALVTTTSLYTLEDDIVQPEVIDPTSDLPGAVVIPVQQACPLLVTDHFGMTVNAPAFYLTYDALTHGGSASLSRFNAATQCTFLTDATIPNPFVTVPFAIKQAALDAIAVVFYQPKAYVEPLLKKYVCDKGAASTYCESS